MHKKSKGNHNLTPLDIEREAIVRKRGKEARRKRKEAKIAGEAENMVLHDYTMPKTTRADSSIVWHAVKAQNFELKLSLVMFVKRDQFGR